MANKYRIKNISRQVLSIEGGFHLLIGQTLVMEKTPRLETFERRGWVSISPDKDKDKEKAGKETAPVEEEEESTDISRITTTENQTVPVAVPTDKATSNSRVRTN